MLDRLFRRAATPPAPPPQDYAAGWRDARAQIAVYLRGYAVSLRTQAIVAERRHPDTSIPPALWGNAAAVDAAADHVERMERDRP